jgi:hypothetical protein
MPRSVALAFLLVAGAAAASDGLKDGWTKEELESSSAGCTDQLVQGAWENTKRDQGVDPAKRYSKAEAEKSPKDLDRFVADVVSRGVCKLEQP